MIFSRSTSAALHQKVARRVIQECRPVSASRHMATLAASASPQPHHQIHSTSEKWSSSLSYANAESDFTASDRFVQHRSSNKTEWSRSMSYANAESNFTASDQFVKSINKEWSHSMSFANAESDFTASDQFANNAPASEWSHSMSFANAESDFTASDQFAEETAAASNSSFSFASPESDFTGLHHSESAEAEWSRDLSFASPESDFVAATRINEATEQQQVNHALFKWQNTRIYESTATIASPESALGYMHMSEVLNRDLLNQYNDYARDSTSLVDQNSVHAKMGQANLPKTIGEALEDPRPIVITSASSPFVVFDVNEAWVGLCGYTREEALDRKLGDLLQGPDTDAILAGSMVKQLKAANYSEAILTNYAKSGRKFQNHIQVGRLSTKDGASDFFVGVLSELGGKQMHSSVY